MADDARAKGGGSRRFPAPPRRACARLGAQGEGGVGGAGEKRAKTSVAPSISFGRGGASEGCPRLQGVFLRQTIEKSAWKKCIDSLTRFCDECALENSQTPPLFPQLPAKRRDRPKTTAISWLRRPLGLGAQRVMARNVFSPDSMVCDLAFERRGCARAWRRGRRRRESGKIKKASRKLALRR